MKKAEVGNYVLVHTGPTDEHGMPQDTQVGIGGHSKFLDIAFRPH